MKNIMVDAGPLIALFNRSDKYHQQVLNFMKTFSGKLITTWPVITETLHMLDFNVHIQLDVMTWIHNGGLEIYDLQGYQWGRLMELTRKYSDIPMDLADATLIILSEELKVKEILTIDMDFYIYRNIRNEYLTNVLVGSM